jgi:hypothetical protein
VNICSDYINKASHTEYYLDENSRNFLMYTLRCDEEAERLAIAVDSEELPW